MKKILFYTAATFTLAMSIGTVIAQPTIAASNFARITSFSEFPKGIRHWRILRHTLKITTPQQINNMSQIIIEAPDNINLSDNTDIKVSNQSGKKINASVAIDEKKAVLTFSKPVAPGTKLTIEMNKVRKLRATTGEMLYKVFANFVDSNQAIPIGIARLRIN